MSWLKNDRAPLTVSPKENTKGHSGFGTKTKPHVSVSKGREFGRDTVGHSGTQSEGKRLILTCNEDGVLVKKVSPMTESNQGQGLSRPDIAKRLKFIDLCKEFQSRTGNSLCITDESVLKRFTAELVLGRTW